MFQEMKPEDLQRILTQLDQALYNHLNWFNSLIRTIICHLPADKHDLCEEPHKECRFGQWYYSDNAKVLHEHPGFKAIAEEHYHLHQLAKTILKSNAMDATVLPHDYDNFSNSLERLQLEINTLKKEVENRLYNHDSLTGTINRVNMITLVREQQEIAKRENHTCFIAMMDIDNFKEANDKFGHSIGDKLLSSVAHFISENLRPEDKIFRYGGEEFLISLNNIEENNALNQIEGIRNKIAETDIIKEPQPTRITCSFGLAALDLNIPVEQSINHADQALLSAKSSGKNCTKVWNPEMK